MAEPDQSGCANRDNPGPATLEKTKPVKKGAAGLVSIASFKLGKGIFFLLVAWGVYALSDDNLPQVLRDLLHDLRLNPEHEAFKSAYKWLGSITENNLLWVAGGTLAYASLALTEGIGLFLRHYWAAYLTIAEAAVFIPLEVVDLSHRFRWGVAALFAFNIFILVYLWRNRQRLFHHIREHRRAEQAAS